MSSSTARVRRHREREKRDEIILMISANRTALIDRLIEARLLGASADHDHAAIVKAGLYFGSEADRFTGFNVGDGFSGGLVLQLVGGATFAPVGTTGDAYWGLGLVGAWSPNGPQYIIGQWEIVSVVTPLPAALPLFVGGVGLIGLLARRRKQRHEAGGTAQ